MATQTGSAKAKESSAKDVSQHSSVVPIEHRSADALKRINHRIARRAYELYADGGYLDGGDLAHWLAAESEFWTNTASIVESDSSYTLTVPVHGFAAEDLWVGVEPRRAVIVGEREDSGNGTNLPGVPSSLESLYLISSFPGEVDPSAVDAELKGETLTVKVRRTPTPK